jgi:Fe-S-cluster containining protein
LPGLLKFEKVKEMGVNLCLSCGACCAFYRASFYWSEAEENNAGGVPLKMTTKLNDFRLVMRGTEGVNPRCIALLGDIGHSVRCSIYERRASICREFEPSWQNHVPNPRCDKARLAWGLKPLKPDTWLNPKGFPKAA